MAKTSPFAVFKQKIGPVPLNGRTVSSGAKVMLKYKVLIIHILFSYSA
jgi:hypothetical protein